MAEPGSETTDPSVHGVCTPNLITGHIFTAASL
jgi:hypothetical protein